MKTPRSEPRSALVVFGADAALRAALRPVLAAAGAIAPRAPATFAPDIFADLETAALTAAGSAPDDLFAPQKAVAGSGEAEAAISAYLDANFAEDARAIALTGPTPSLLAPLWEADLKARGYEPAYVFLVGEPSGLLWLSRVLAAERDTRDAKRIFVTAEQLSDPRRLLARLHEMAALPSDADIDLPAASDPVNPAAPPAAWEGVHRVHAALRAAALGAPLDTGLMDEVAAQLQAAAQVLGAPLEEARITARRARQDRTLEDRSLAAQVEILRRELGLARGLADKARTAPAPEQPRAPLAPRPAAAPPRRSSSLRPLKARAQGLRERLNLDPLLRRLQQVSGRDGALIAGSGFFDADWYLQTNPDVAAARTPPLRHFLRAGWREGRHPARSFDLNYYQWAHPDVARSKINPLLHYLRFGRAENRAIMPVGAWEDRPSPTPPQAEVVRMDEIAPTSDLPRIAVAVHAFYADVFEDICARLVDVPGRFTLLVATPTPEGKAAALAAIARHGLNAEADVRVARNRGRNFGPLLAEFAPAILQHDLLLHLHTKKSTYAGAGERKAWREHLYGALVGGADQIGRVLGLFAQRPEVGLVYGQTFREMPYWSHHWLQNGEAAAALFARLGIGSPGHGYIDYPVGGMFWARVEAIRPLLAAGFAYEDFPEEAGQTDGTLAHAIERCFVDLARDRGFTFAESDTAAGLYRIGWSEKNLAVYASHSSRSLKAAIDMADIVSFDIFDTLITRPSLSPDAVQQFVGLALGARHPQATDFYLERKAAETRARLARDGAGDVGLAEIYAAFPKAWGPQLREDAMALECEIEIRITRARPPVAEALAYAHAQGKRVVLVSDTYFDIATIRALLAASGLAQGDIDAIHLSSQVGARKDRGDIWPWLMDQERAAGRGWLHVGDNEMSDIQRVVDLGQQAYHVMNPVTLLGHKGFVPAELAADWPSAILLGPSAAKLAADPFMAGGATGPVEVGSAHDLGYAVFGPAVFAFLAWLAQRPELATVDRLHFLSREGWVLRPAYEALRAAAPARRLPPSGYLYTSRRCVMMAGQAVKFDPAAIMAGAGGFSGSFKDLLQARLGYAPTGADVNQAIVLPGDAKAVRQRIAAQEAGILAQAKGELAAYGRYLAAEGVGAGGAVVDVGFSATTQKVLQKILGHGLGGFYMTTFADAKKVREGGGYALGAFGDGLHPSSDKPVVRHALLLEAFLTAPHGQVDNLVWEGDTPRPIFRDAGRSPEQAALLEEMHAGAVAYVENLVALYGPEVIDLPVRPDAALAPIQALALGRVRAPADVLQVLKVDDAFSGNEELAIGARLAAHG